MTELEALTSIATSLVVIKYAIMFIAAVKVGKEIGAWAAHITG